MDDADESPWRVITEYAGPDGKKLAIDQPVDRADALLTVSETEAVAFGLSKGIASTLDQLTTALGLNTAPRTIEFSGW